MDRTVFIISNFLTADVWNLWQPRKWSTYAFHYGGVSA